MTGHQTTWHRGVHTCFIPPMFLLPWLSSVSSHGSHSVHYLMAIYGLRHLSLHQMHVILYTSTSTTHYLKSSPVLSGCSVRCAWEKFQLPVDPPQGSLPGLTLGDHHTTYLLMVQSFLSHPLGVCMNGVGLVHLSCAWQTPTHKGTPVSDMQQGGVQFQCRMCDCPHWSVTSYEGMSVIIWCTTSWSLSSYLSLIFVLSLKGISLH